MSDKQDAKCNQLVLSGEHGLITRSEGIARRGLTLLDSIGFRVLNFPEDRSIGYLSVMDPDYPHYYYPVEIIADDLGEARGTIKVLQGKVLELSIYKEALGDLSPLSSLPSDIICVLNICRGKIEDSQLACIQGLTGLRRIDLRNCSLAKI